MCNRPLGCAVLTVLISVLVWRLEVVMTTPFHALGGVSLVDTLFSFEGQSGIRRHPLNQLVARNIQHRAGKGGVWRDESEGYTDGWGSWLRGMPQLKVIRHELTKSGGAQFLAMRDEYLRWEADHSDDMGASVCYEFPWQRSAYLRIGGWDTALAQEFPVTSALVKRAGFFQAGFNSLEPGARLYPHRGPEAGILRYHLSLVVPQEDKDESERRSSQGSGGCCGIKDCVGPPARYPMLNRDDKTNKLGKAVLPFELPLDARQLPDLHFGLCLESTGQYSHQHDESHCLLNTSAEWLIMQWREGEDFLFDDNNLHYVINGRNTRRLTFTADVLRPNLPIAVWLLNQFVHHFMASYLPDVTRMVGLYDQLYRELSSQRRFPRADGGFGLAEQCAFDMANDDDTWGEPGSDLCLVPTPPGWGESANSA